MDSQKSRTGFRLALTDGTTSGTVRVWWATTCTPTMTVPRVCRTARRWKMTRIRPSAAAATISAVMTRVTQATAGMTIPLSAQKLGYGARVPGRAQRDVGHGLIGHGEHL